MKSRIFYHHETGRPIIRELNIPTVNIPEYYPVGYFLSLEEVLAVVLPAISVDGDK